MPKKRLARRVVRKQVRRMFLSQSEGMASTASVSAASRSRCSARWSSRYPIETGVRRRTVRRTRGRCAVSHAERRFECRLGADGPSADYRGSQARAFLLRVTLPMVSALLMPSEKEEGLEPLPGTASKEEEVVDMARVERVTFEFFLKAAKLVDTYKTRTGAVECDGDRMVLEVPCPGEHPYVIVGHRQDWGGFSGRHEGEPDDIEVTADWNNTGDRWLGTWIEEGNQYVFSAVAPRQLTAQGGTAVT